MQGGATLTCSYILDEETVCALVDIVRAGNTNSVTEGLKNQLLLRLANVAMQTFFSERFESVSVGSNEDVVDFSGYELMISFSRLRHLP